MLVPWDACMAAVAHASLTSTGQANSQQRPHSRLALHLSSPRFPPTDQRPRRTTSMQARHGDVLQPWLAYACIVACPRQHLQQRSSVGKCWYMQHERRGGVGGARRSRALLRGFRKRVALAWARLGPRTPPGGRACGVWAPGARGPILGVSGAGLGVVWDALGVGVCGMSMHWDEKL